MITSSVVSKDKMEKMERLLACLSGQPVDRWAYALWRHFPEVDRTPQGFVAAHSSFYRKYEPDVLKLSPHGLYCNIDWGVEAGPVDPFYASPKTLSYPIKAPKDYLRLEELDPLEGEFGLQVEGVRRVAKQLQGQVPLMMTVFCPLMVASGLDVNIAKNLQHEGSEIHEGLKVITKVMTNFGRAVLDAGSDGLFVASRYTVTSRDQLTQVQLTEEQFRSYEVKYTLQLLKNLKSHAKFIVIHLHGDHPRFQFVAENYPIDAINWHSAHTPPSIPEALRLFKKGLFAGIDEVNILRTGTADMIRDAIQQTVRNATPQLILAPGCVIRPDTPHENLLALVKSIREAPLP